MSLATLATQFERGVETTEWMVFAGYVGTVESELRAAFRAPSPGGEKALRDGMPPE